jgi:Ca-activated chloride channel family protein
MNAFTWKGENSGFEVINAETGQPMQLAMEGLWLTGQIVAVGARLVAVHEFRSGESKPLEVVYAFGLPRDAALRRFKITGDGFQVRSELKPVAEAQAEYEKGINRGNLAALTRVYRDGRVNLSVGNIRPGEVVKVYLEMVAGVDLRDDGLRFSFPFTLAPCYHKDAKCIAVEPGVGEIELPEAEFGDILLPQYMTDRDKLHHVGFELSIGMGANIAAVSSPSHAIRVSGTGSETARVALSVASDVPDRDLVLDVQTADARPRVCGGLCQDGKAHFNVVVPSTRFDEKGKAPKSVVFVLDHSGSMGGEPLVQAKQAVAACLAVLDEKDHFGLVAFDDRDDFLASTLIPATMKNREKGLRFLDGITARGGTELAAGIASAVEVAGRSPADFFLVTDGQVSGTEDIVSQFRGTGKRIHCLGIGAASQDRFLTLLARETGGTSRCVTPRERVDMEALELFAGVGQPVAENLEVEFNDIVGAHTVGHPQPVVFEGHPCTFMAEASQATGGTMTLRWGRGEEKSQLAIPLVFSQDRSAETVRLLQGARLITDCDTHISGEPAGWINKLLRRQQNRATEKLMDLSRTYGLASRVMALVAVVQRQGDDATTVPTTRVVPVGMPQDVPFKGYFAGVSQRMCMAQDAGERGLTNCFIEREMARKVGGPPPSVPSIGDEVVFQRSHGRFRKQPSPEQLEAFAEAQAKQRDGYQLVVLAARMLPDGGMPGTDLEARVLKSLALLVCFLFAGHNCQTGPFRMHVQKLAAFVRSNLGSIGEIDHRQLAELLVLKAEKGESLPNARLPKVTALLACCAAVTNQITWDLLKNEVY